MDQLEITGEFFFPFSTCSQNCRLIAECDGVLKVKLEDGQDLANLRIESIQGFANVHFEGGGSFKSHALLPRQFLKLHQTRSRRFITWLEAFSFPKAVILMVVLIALLFTLRVVTGVLTSFIAAAVPVSWEQKLGSSSYEALRPLVFAESEIPSEQRARIREHAEAFFRMAEDLETVQIYFHQSELFGANALAFPGGPIVVTDALVARLNLDETVAVIAHELAHIRARHSLQRIIEIAGLSFVAYLVFGLDESVVEEVTAVLIQIWAAGRTREFEKEADLLGLELMQHAKLNPQYLVSAIEKLVQASCGEEDMGSEMAGCQSNHVHSWFSTHPSPSVRIDYLNTAIED